MSGFYGRLHPTQGVYINNVAQSGVSAMFYYVSGDKLSTAQIVISSSNYTQSGGNDWGYYYQGSLYLKRTDLEIVRVRYRAVNRYNTQYFDVYYTAEDMTFAPSVVKLPSDGVTDAYFLRLLSINELMTKNIITSSEASAANGGSSYIDITLYFDEKTTATVTNNVSGSSESHTTDGNSIEITVRSTKGEYYGFKTPPTAAYTDVNGAVQSGTATITRTQYNDDTATFSLQNVDFDEDIIINGASTHRAYVAVSSLQNATTDFVSNYYYTDVPLVVTIVANDGYYWENAPYLHYGNTDVSFTINGRTATLTAALTADSANIYAVAAVAPLPTHNFVNNIANSTLHTTIEGNTVTATITANDIDVRFSTAPTVTYYINGVLTTSPLNVSMSGGRTVANGTFTADYDTVAFNGSLTQIIPIETNLTNSRGVDIPPYVFVDTDTVTFAVQANDGYGFEVEPHAEIWGVMISGDVYPFEFTEIEEPYVNATCTIDLAEYERSYIRSIDIYADATPLTAYDYGAINVYKVTKGNLNQLAAVRLGYGANNEDLGDYVITLKRMYFSVGYCLDDVLRLGNYNLNINVKTPLIDKKVINCGTLTVPPYNNNNADFDTEISAFLPFVGIVTIPSDYVGKEIELNYVVSTVTGEGYAQLLYNSIVFATYSCAVSDNLIFEKITNDAKINQLQAQKLQGLKPYVIVKYFADISENIVNNESKRMLLNDVSGFAVCSEISDLDVNAPSDVKEMIIKELEKGCYF